MAAMLEIGPGIKIAAQVDAEPSAEQLSFIRQMGLEYVVLWTGGDKASPEYYASRRRLFENHGLKIYGFGNWDVHNQDAIVLNLEHRDAKIEEYKQHLRALGQAGIPYTTYAHMANGIWSTAREATRGGADARGFNLEEADFGHWQGRHYAMPLSHGRTYSPEELWDNYHYFVSQVVPVAEDEGVLIGIHPDDPPGVDLAGVPRCLFGSHDGYARAMAMTDSPNLGICFCIGCWLEGGERMGKGVEESIREFGGQGKIFKVHFRNVDAPLPHFVETFVDDGYFDMYRALRVLQEVHFRGVLIPDHIPNMAGDPKVGTAFSIGYMKALVERVEAEIPASRAVREAAVPR